MRVLDPYMTAPKELQEGDVMYFVLKAMVTRNGYRIYRCKAPLGVTHSDPQGMRIDADTEKAVANAVFPLLGWAKIEPDPL